MLRVVAVVMKNNQKIGYQLFDGSDKFMLTEGQLWKTAQRQQIENVEITGTAESPIIKSTMAYDLSALPQIEYSTIN